MEFRTGYLDVNGIQAYYQSVMPGSPTIVFIHGWSFNLQTWSRQVEYFGNGTRANPYNIVSYDMRGMGDSTGQDDVSDFNNYVEDLSQIITTLNLDMPIICGHSMGGGVAMQYAVNNADKISGLVLLDSPLQTPKNRIQDIIAGYGLELVEMTVGMYPTSLIWEKAFFSDTYRNARPDGVEAWRHQYLSNDGTSIYKAFIGYAERDSMYKNTGNLTMPVLVAQGSEDLFVSEELNAALVKSLSNAELQIISGAGHCSYVEQPNAFNEIMDAWLNDKVV